jgi:hypothetical protein
MGTRLAYGRRRRRLVLVGAGWAVLLLMAAALARPADSSRPRSLALDAIRVQQGRLYRPDELAPKSRANPRLSRVVSALAGEKTRVMCWSQRAWRNRVRGGLLSWSDDESSWRAYTIATWHSIHLSPEVCAELAKLEEHEGSLATYESIDAVAWSVGMLAHEAQHAAGTHDEVAVECAGAQSVARAARLLGRTRQESRFLATVYWKHWYLWHSPGYSSPDCRNRGPLDARPAVDLWP